MGSLSFRKSMRWRPEAAFSRPLRWLLALHGATPLPFDYAGLQAGTTTRLLRNAPQPEVGVQSADDYLGVLEGGRITLSLEDRKDRIWAGVQQAAHDVGGELGWWGVGNGVRCGWGGAGR